MNYPFCEQLVKLNAEQLQELIDSILGLQNGVKWIETKYCTDNGDGTYDLVGLYVQCIKDGVVIDSIFIYPDNTTSPAPPVGAEPCSDGDVLDSIRDLLASIETILQGTLDVNITNDPLNVQVQNFNEILNEPDTRWSYGCTKNDPNYPDGTRVRWLEKLYPDGTVELVDGVVYPCSIVSEITCDCDYSFEPNIDLPADGDVTITRSGNVYTAVAYSDTDTANLLSVANDFLASINSGGWASIRFSAGATNVQISGYGSANYIGLGTSLSPIIITVTIEDYGDYCDPKREFLHDSLPDDLGSQSFTDLMVTRAVFECTNPVTTPPSITALDPQPVSYVCCDGCCDNEREDGTIANTHVIAECFNGIPMYLVVDDNLNVISTRTREDFGFTCDCNGEISGGTTITAGSPTCSIIDANYAYNTVEGSLSSAECIEFSDELGGLITGIGVNPAITLTFSDPVSGAPGTITIPENTVTSITWGGVGTSGITITWSDTSPISSGNGHYNKVVIS